MGAQAGPLGAVVAEIARRQHGVVTREQLLDAGVGRATVPRWIRAGRLHPVHRGVYRVGHRAPSLEAHYLAAVLACGEGAALAGFAAAHLHRVVRSRRPPAPEVIASTKRIVSGVVTHRARAIDRRDRTLHLGIPTTSVPRTLADLASRLTLEDLAAACHQAQVLHRLEPRQLTEVLTRRPTTPGAAKLLLVANGDAPVLLSRLEREFRALLRGAGLPLPATNVLREEGYVDCRWAAHALTVELDSFRFHNSRRSWERGYERERAARRRGDRFRRLTWRDVVEEPDATVESLRGLLARR